MNIQHLLETVEEIANELYPDVPEVAKLCQAIIVWERDNMSVKTPQYKDSYQKLLKGVEKRWQSRLSKTEQGE
jgi:hypothetical protein